MMRLSTLFWIVLAGALGFGLYHLKQEVAAQEDQLFRLNRQILAEQEAIHVLHAEWSYINQPSRLQSLASRHLDLRPTKTMQLGALKTLPLLPGQTAPAAAPPGAAAPLIAAAPQNPRNAETVSASTPVAMRPVSLGVR